MWTARRLAEKAQIQAYLECDRVFGAYALGDLEPALYGHTEWAGAYRDGKLEALTLHYRGLRIPALVMMGEPDGLAAILEARLRPKHAYLTCLEAHLNAARAHYVWDELAPMWRMALGPVDPGPIDKGACVRLTRQHNAALESLYAVGHGNAYDPSQIERGVFYGRLAQGALISVAGTHLVSAAYGVAAIGNVFTHPAHRGLGHATAATRAVLAELRCRGIGTIVLNVRQDNLAALAVYEKLGFQRHCPFLEGIAMARS